MRTLIFASTNPHKTAEIASVLPRGYRLENLLDMGFTTPIPEPFLTFQENALHKVEVLAKEGVQGIIMSEDSGLEVNALQGAPGVCSARYALAAKGRTQSEANIEKLLAAMQGMEDRRAHFVSVFCLRFPNGDLHFFKDLCEGVITEKKQGNSPFGYDPIFQPKGAKNTFGEMTMEEKKQYSHREKAFEKLCAFLLSI